MIPAVVIQALRHWRLAVAGILILLAGVMYVKALRAERSLAKAQTQIAIRNEAIRSCNRATDALKADSDRRQQEQAEALRQAREANERQGSTIESLRRGSVTPRTAPGCSISDELRRTENAL